MLFAAFCIGLGINIIQNQRAAVAAKKWQVERDAVWSRFQTQSRQAENLGSVGKESFIGSININRANKQELQQLPRIGPVLAERIITYRAQVHNFKQCDDIQNVRGIGPKTFENIKDYITVD